jgi:ribosomal protein S15P/S13E
MSSKYGSIEFGSLKIRGFRSTIILKEKRNVIDDHVAKYVLDPLKYWVVLDTMVENRTLSEKDFNIIVDRATSLKDHFDIKYVRKDRRGMKRLLRNDLEITKIYHQLFYPKNK